MGSRSRSPRSARRRAEETEREALPIPSRATSSRGDGEDFGLSAFIRDGGDIFRTYFTNRRGVETLGPVWTLLDLTPLGRQEKWEDSPEGSPQTEPYQWWRRHDEYGA